MLQELANSDEVIKIVAVAVRDSSIPRPDLPPGAQLITDPAELAATKPDVVAEAAGRESVEPWGRAALEAGADFIVSSVSAFADAALLEALTNTARHTNSSLQIQPGAVAGIEALAAARVLGIDHVEHRMVKPPVAWRGTPAESLCGAQGRGTLDTLTEATTFFSASAAEAAHAFPKNANVAMTTALAGIGPKDTKITLVADPTAKTNRHEVIASGAFGSLEVTISNNPLPGNPKSSAMAALSLVRVLHNRVSSIIL